jgi:hypothetical protein
MLFAEAAPSLASLEAEAISLDTFAETVPFASLRQ